MKSSNFSIAILFASLVIVMLGFGIAIPLMPFYITHFNASGSALGLVMALFSFAQFIFAPLWGRLSDRVGRKPVLLFGLSGYAVTFFLVGVTQNLVQFALVRTLAGVFSAATLPTAMAFIADTTSPENRARGVGLMGAAMGVGMIFGPMLGGLLTGVSIQLPEGLAALQQVTSHPATGEPINLSIPFFVSALLAFLDVFFVVFFLPESLPVEKRIRVETKGQARLAQLMEGLRGPLGFLFILSFLIAFALANIEAILALYGQQQFQMGPAEIGYLMGIMGVLSVIMQGGLIGPLTHRFGEVRIIRAGLAVSILGFLCLALANTKPLLITAAIVFNTGNVLLMPSVTALISKRARTGQGEAMGLGNSFQSLGRAVGPLWAGYAYDIYSRLSIFTGAIIQLVALVVAMRQLHEEKADTPLRHPVKAVE